MKKIRLWKKIDITLLTTTTQKKNKLQSGHLANLTARDEATLCCPNSSVICPIWSNPHIQKHKHTHNIWTCRHTHIHTCLAKGGPVVLFHRGSRVVITDL